MSALPVTTVPLGAEEALRVEAGEVMVFTARRQDGGGLGRWALVSQVSAPAVVLGADLDNAALFASPLPDAVFEPLAASGLTDDERAAALNPGEDAPAALTRADETRLAKTHADQLAERHDAWLVRDALTDLADAVPGHVEQLPAGDASADIAVMAQLASLVGLPADPVRLRRAVTDSQVSGRDRIAALTAACDASARRVELPADWWTAAGPPLLVTQSDGTHAVAAWARGAYRLWTPDHGYSAGVDKTSAEQVQSTALVLQPLLDPTKRGSMRELLRVATRGSGASVALVLIMTAVVGVLNAVIPVVVGRITTSVASGASTSLITVAVALILLVVAVTMLNAVRTFAIIRVRTSSTAIASGAVWDRQLRLPMKWHKDRTEVARMTSSMSVDLASGQAPNSAVIALLDTAAVIGSVLGALIASAWVALAIVAFLIIRTLVDVRLVRRLVALAGQTVDEAALDPTTELLRGVMPLRSAGALARGYSRWARFAATATRTRVRLGRVGTIQAMLGVLWPTLGLAILLSVVALTSGAASESAAIGVLVTAQTALTSANTALAAAIGSIGALLAARAVLRRAEPILTAVPESAGGGEVAPLSGGIDVRGVVYRYRDDLPPIFDGLSLSVRPGEHLALVGPSGSGKTTLLRLLLGLDDPESGLVAYDGRDLTGLDRSAVRRQLGVVMQSSALLPGSIRDNVEMGRGLTATQVWEALEMASVADDVKAMPMGLNTVVVDGGAGVSGGQRQRILLARALAGSPRILILDEATSALDNISQRAVGANLDRLDVTRIVVAHRLSTIERADRIAVISGGRISAVGTYDELAAQPGPFQDLVSRQRLD